MAQKIQLLVYPVKDLEKAKNFYSKFLGQKPYIDSRYYIGYKIGELEVGLDPNSNLGPIAYIDVADINSYLQDLLDTGAQLVEGVKDVGQGLLVAQIKDPDGNVVGLRQTS